MSSLFDQLALHERINNWEISTVQTLKRQFGRYERVSEKLQQGHISIELSVDWYMVSPIDRTQTLWDQSIAQLYQYCAYLLRDGWSLKDNRLLPK